ncbi:hypothetical protein [Mitsuaria sp. GD03876]|uniref:hypothetical protein n=1 Tax=Mitsuaria sp. GD03876 TaxID=2975399 RepID=UPI002447C147|nr:hypothetical protein [Mitsuaria sp. GD03876]MDH0865252.1 hypothetical protein [Mitsuaria sp. GD03876]
MSNPQARWERLVMRRPGLALPRLQRLIARESEPPFQVLLGAFFILERWGRGPELQAELERALARALQHRLLEEAAELSEALGRMHYQRGDYVQACNAWSQTLELADDETRWACLARIGLAHLCFALGDWARGGRVLDQAELHYPQLGDDPYMRSKIALNRAVSLRATQGPQAALPRLDEARADARAVGHRDYEAEAMWHHARCARDSGAVEHALTLAVEAEDLARRCRYRWLQAQTLLLISELRRGAEAAVPAQQALALGEAIQSRSLQAAAHGRLGQLMAEQEQLGPSWFHQQQRQRLEATLGQTELPARLEQLARFDTDPHGAEGLLLALGRGGAPVTSAADVDTQWQQARPRLMEALAVSDLELRWTGLGGAPAPVTPERRDRSSQTMPLRDATGAVVGELVLARAAGAVWSRADRSRAERLAGWLQRLIVQVPAPGAGGAADAPGEPGPQARELVELLERLATAADADADARRAGLSQALALARRLAARLG